jgi:uncharacterized protein YigA (DUF484 family)
MSSMNRELPENSMRESPPDPSPVEGEAPALNDDVVARYLLQHPQFFHRHSPLLLQLSIPHESGKAISLLERQVAVFRERQAQLQDQFHEFLVNAHANDNLFEKTRQMILALLGCGSLATVRDLITTRFCTEFGASAAGLLLVSDAPAPLDSGLPCIPTSAARAALGELYQKQTTYCGPLNGVQSELLFGVRQTPLLSAAVVPLKTTAAASASLQQGLPLLLIASEQREYFNSTLDTLFLDFLGEVLAAHLSNLLLPTAAR